MKKQISTSLAAARGLTYHLYIWRRHPEAHGYLIRRRGRCIGHFARWADLLAEAQRRTASAGYPKSRWMDLYDWNEGAR